MLADTPSPSLAEAGQAIDAAARDVVSKMPNFGEGLGEQKEEMVEAAIRSAYENSMVTIMREIPEMRKRMMAEEKTIRATLKDGNGAFYQEEKDAAGNTTVKRNDMPKDKNTLAMYNQMYRTVIFGGPGNPGLVGNTTVKIR